MPSTSLYRRVLGPDFDALPAVLKRFHDAAEGGRAQGTFRVVRGSGVVRNIVASLLRLPKAGENVPICLEVVVQGDRERWLRHFPGRCTTTVEWADGNLLMERFGLSSFSSILAVEGSRVRYIFQRAWLAGIPLPVWLSPHVESYVDAGETGWRVVVHIFAPILGEIVHYEGWVEPL
jgi:hypothetical protein